MLYYTTQPDGLLNDFMKNVRVRHIIKTLSWIAKNSKHIYVDRNWQRNFVWATLKQMLFTTNIFNGHSTSTNMLLANDYNTIVDMNEDGTLNVLDIVILANCILDENCEDL